MRRFSRCAFSMNCARRWRMMSSTPADFARVDHLAEQPVERLRVLRHRVGKRRSRLHVLGHLAQDRLQQARTLLGLENLQRTQQRKTRILQRRELTRELRQLLLVHAADGEVQTALFALLLLFARQRRRPVLRLALALLLAHRTQEVALALDPLDRLFGRSRFDRALLLLAGGVERFIRVSRHCYRSIRRPPWPHPCITLR